MQICNHTGQPVTVGPYQVWAGGTQYPDFLPGRFDHPGSLVLVSLLPGHLPESFTAGREVVPLPMQDFGGVPGNWGALLAREIVPRLRRQQPLLAFCVGSHGRTGTFLASLIALLETPEATPDPIATVRQRHCIEAVETEAQARAIFALRSQRLPLHYRGSFYC